MEKFQKIPSVDVLRGLCEMLKNPDVNNLGRSWFSNLEIPVKSKDLKIFSEMNGLGRLSVFAAPGPVNRQIVIHAQSADSLRFTLSSDLFRQDALPHGKS